MADDREERPEDAAVQADPPAEGDVTDEDAPRRNEGPALRFGPDDTGPLPHWTEPPTGEVPKILADEPQDDVDPWSSFSGQAPVWRDDQQEGTEAGFDLGPLTGDLPPIEDGGGLFDTGDQPTSVPPSRRAEEPSPPPAAEDAPASDQTRVTPIRTRGNADTGRTRREPPPPPTSGAVGARDLPMAVAVGFGLAAIFILLLTLGEKYVVGLVVVLLAVAAVEFYDTVRSKGYQPAQFIGLAAVIGLPLGAYWVGADALGLILVLAFMATSVWGLASGSVESGPLPNTAITTLGVVYIGLLGSYASLILRMPSSSHGRGILFAAVAGAVMNDVGAFFVGSSAGRTPVAAWISPKKTVEGLVGGALLTVLTLFVIKLIGIDPWSDANWGKVFLFALVIVLVTPIGDFTESMFKRNLDVKDFGTLLPGHGGILDRFDGILFVLPAAYYAAIVIEPWV
jgi:phosphatidate cytidylyltransferase